jgi:hypothetical protein
MRDQQSILFSLSVTGIALAMIMAAIVATIALIWIGRNVFGIKPDPNDSPGNFLDGLPNLKYVFDFGFRFALRKFWINIPFWLLITFVLFQNDPQPMSANTIYALVLLTIVLGAWFAWNEIKTLLSNDPSYIPTYFGLLCLCILSVAALMKFVDGFVVPIGKYESPRAGWIILLFYPSAWALILCGLTFKLVRGIAKWKKVS